MGPQNMDTPGAAPPPLALPPAIMHAAPALCAADSADLARLGAALGDALIGVHLHANHAKRSQFEPAEGRALVLAPAAPLRPETVNSNMNGQVMVARILGRASDAATLGQPSTDATLGQPSTAAARPLTLADFAGAAAALETLPEEHSGFAHAAVIDSVTGGDVLPWVPVLGTGSLVGVYRTRMLDGADGDDGAPPLFFLAAVVSETPAGKDAHAYLEQCAASGMSTLAYARDETARRLRRLAARNARRLLAAAAVALGVTIEWERDVHAVGDSQRGAGAAAAAAGASKPLSALPQVHSEFNVFSRPLHTASAKEPVVFYDHCQDVFAAHGGVVLQLDVRQGLRVAQAPRASCGQFINEAADNSYPLRLRAGANAAAAKTGYARITWPGKATGAPCPEPSLAPLAADTGATLDGLAPGAEPLELVPVAVRLTRARDF